LSDRRSVEEEVAILSLNKQPMQSLVEGFSSAMGEVCIWLVPFFWQKA